MAATTKTVINGANPKTNERIFLLCDKCLWTATCLNKIYLQEITETEPSYTCPMCNEDELSSFPISPSDSFTYNFSKMRGVELTFGIKKNEIKNY